MTRTVFSMCRPSTILGICLLFGASFASAQDAPILRSGVFEVGGFVGASYGIDSTRVMGGGNVVYSWTRVLMPFAEVSYFPGIGRQQKVPGLPTATETFSIPLTDYNVGFHLRVPIPRSRVIPYAVVSVGGIHTPSRQVQDSFTADASSDFAVSGGAGIRYYAKERWGFRGEFKMYKPTGNFTDPFYRVAAGIFFQF